MSGIGSLTHKTNANISEIWESKKIFRCIKQIPALKIQAIEEVDVSRSVISNVPAPL